MVLCGALQSLFASTIHNAPVQVKCIEKLIMEYSILFIFIVSTDTCLPGWEVGTVSSCTPCEMNTMNPVVGGACVPCNGSMISNDKNTHCSTYRKTNHLKEISLPPNICECHP